MIRHHECIRHIATKRKLMIPSERGIVKASPNSTVVSSSIVSLLHVQCPRCNEYNRHLSLTRANYRISTPLPNCSLTRVTSSSPNPHSHTCVTTNGMPLPDIICQIFSTDDARLSSYPSFTDSATDVFYSGADPHHKGRGMNGNKVTQTSHIDNTDAGNGVAIPVNGRAGNGAAVQPLNGAASLGAHSTLATNSLRTSRGGQLRQGVVIIDTEATIIMMGKEFAMFVNVDVDNLRQGPQHHPQ